MKKLLLIPFLLFFVLLSAQNRPLEESKKRPLDESVFDTWNSLKSFTISDDAQLSFAQYERYKDKPC